MHLIETYALNCGLKIEKPHIKLEEVELPKKKYITLHTHCDKGSARDYNNWHNITMGLTTNSKFDLDIVHIGDLQSERLIGCNNKYLGKTNFHQLSYLLKNAELHLGYDSLPVHIASHFSTNIVVLYNAYSQHSYPYWSKPEDVALLEVDYNKYGKPAYAYTDPLDLMNKIEYTSVIDSVLGLLGFMNSSR